MLSDDDKAQIEAEESAELAALRERQSEATRQIALMNYRESVKTALGTTPRRSRLVLPLVLSSAVGAVAILVMLALPRASPVRGRIGDLAWTFPTPIESASQISSNADGKRWDGWVRPRVQQGEEDAKTQFSCQCTPATDSRLLNPECARFEVVRGRGDHKTNRICRTRFCQRTDPLSITVPREKISLLCTDSYFK